MICETHGTADGFIVCRHVIAGAGVAHYLEPSGEAGPDGLGEVLCGPCIGHGTNVIELELICGPCVARLLAARAPAPPEDARG